MAKIFSFSEVETTASELILKKFDECRIFTFVGPLGVGKTTLIKEILKLKGISEGVDSPTFGYVRSYSNRNNETFNHFDLYRIDSIESFMELGFDEYLYTDNGYCFIEWPEVIIPLLEKQSIKNKTCFITISYDPLDQEKRVIAW